MKPRVLIIGCGSIGERHLRCFLRTRRAEMFACENRPAVLEKITQQYNVPDLNQFIRWHAEGKRFLSSSNMRYAPESKQIL